MQCQTVCNVGVGKAKTQPSSMIFIHVRNVDNSDGVAQESIGDIPASFPNGYYILLCSESVLECSLHCAFFALGKISH